MSEPPPEVREDGLLGNRVRLRQPAAGYRVAIDPLLLAAAVPARAEDRVLDLGCGSGAAALCLLQRVPDCEVTGLELQPGLADLATENGILNGRGANFIVVQGDLLAPPAALGRDFDLVLMNPPYDAPGGSTTPRQPQRAAAHQEGAARLQDWIACALSRLKPGGCITVIHRAERLGELLHLLAAGAGEIAIFPLWPKAGRPAKRVLLQGVKGSRAPSRLLPGLLLHRPDGRYTGEAEAVLGEAAPLLLKGCSPDAAADDRLEAAPKGHHLRRHGHP